MDRNSIIGLSLIFLILIGTIFINQPTVEELEQRKKEQDSIAALQRVVKEDSLVQAQVQLDARPDSIRVVEDSIQNSQRMGMFTSLGTGTDDHVVLENEVMQVELASKGGVPYAILLKPYRRASAEGDTIKDPLYLFKGSEHKLNYTFVTTDGRQISTADLYFKPDAGSTVLSGDSATIRMRAQLNDQVFIEQRYTIYPNSFEVGYDLVTGGFDQVISRSANYLSMNWMVEMPKQERHIENERERTTVYYAYLNDEVDELSARKFEKQDADAALKWISFKQQFFNNTLISLDENGFENASVEIAPATDEQHVKTAKANAYLPYDGGKETEYKMRFYFGPNHYQTLETVGHNMTELVPLGWGIFGWVNRGIVIPVFNFLNDYIASFGIIILLLTLIIKLGLLPLVYKSYISTAKMRVIKPEMDEIKEKFGNEPQKLQAENMKLFRKAGVSPLGGCVPMLLQMPILFALFNFFPVSFELRQQSFLWADDLSTFDSIWTFGKVPVLDFVYGDHVSLFTLLMTISTLIYTRMNNQISGISGQMKYMGYIMPIVFLGFFNRYSAGLSYYYFLSNMITFAQQAIIRRFVNDDKIHAKIQENKKKPVKKSKLQERLENMSKQQNLAQKNRQQGKKK